MNGFRVAVKDIFDLHGVRTAASNRAFRDLYPPRKKTASAVQRLIDQGAIVVGKTKTTTFADRELATSDWIDTHSPFNSRGDGYIWGGGSSTGSAAAVAAYSWLDCAVGSDSEISSIRNTPCDELTGWSKLVGALEVLLQITESTALGQLGALMQWTALSLVACVYTVNIIADWLTSLSRMFDTPAPFVRRLDSVEAVAKTWYSPHLQESTSWRPQKVLWPSDYCDPDSKWAITQNQEIHAKFEKFVSELERFLGVKRTVVNMRELWNEKHRQLSRDFDAYFNYTYEAILNRDSYTNNNEFVNDYKEAYGRHPYLPPSIMNRWKHGETITDEERQHAADQVKDFKTWFEKDMLENDGKSKSSAVMVMPWTVGIPNYRDSPRPEPNAEYGYGFQSAYVSSFTGGPELVLPSTVTSSSPMAFSC